MKARLHSIAALSLLIVFTYVLPAHSQWLKDLPAEETESPGNDHPRAAEQWFWGQRAAGLGYVPGDGVQKALAHAQAMRAALSQSKGSHTLSGGTMTQAASVQWSPVGPGNIGGRVNAIAIHPSDPNTIYIGAANGGVWKTTNAGTTWKPLTDNTPSLSMGALAIDPNNPTTVYAGTGELAQAVDTYSGYGMLVSKDAGKTWMTTGPVNVGAYSRIIVNPKNSNIIYAAAGRSAGGVFRSTDGGKTWPRVGEGLPRGQVTDMGLSMNGNTPVLYAAIATLGVYRSVDGGENWTLIKQFPAMIRMQLDVSAMDWKRIAVISVHADGTLDGFEGSTDGGDSWQSMEGNLGPDLFSSGGPAQGWYDVLVRIDPADEDHVIVGGISLWTSNDFGQSWSDAGRAYAGGIHPDQHAFEFAPSNTQIAYVGNDGGFYSSDNGGDSYNDNPGQLPITQFYQISVDQSQDDFTAGGTQDNGSMTGTSKSGWSMIMGGDGGYTIIDPTAPTRIYVTTPNNPFPGMVSDGQYVNIGSALQGYGDSTSWLNPILLDTKNDILYYGSDHLSQSTNHGSSWSHGQTRIPDNSNIQALAAFGDKRNVLAGTSGGHLYLTTDKGRRWKDLSAGLPGRWVTSVHYGVDTNTIYVTLSGYGGGHVFKTTDLGATWKDISGDLPDLPTNALIMDPQNTHVLYVGTDIGVFLSPNDGDVWVPYGAGLPNVSVTSMDIQTSKRVLRVGTHGRSIWEAPMMNDLPGITTPTQRTVWVMGDSASIRWHGLASPVTISISPDCGTTWTQIAAGVNGNAYPIDQVKFSGSQNAMVKVEDGSQELTSPIFEIVQRKSGENLRVIAELPYTLYDVAWDPDAQALWGTNWNDNSSTIYKIDPDKGTVLDSLVLPSSMRNLTGIMYEPNRKHFFIHQAVTDGNSSWFEVTKTGTIVNHATSLASYGTGIYFRNDTLYLADRLSSTVNRVLESDANFVFLPLTFTRTCLYGPRCLSYNAKLDKFMLAYTEFVGTSSSDARLTGSYVLFLDPNDGTETDAYYMQSGSEDVNIRGMEWDPRNGGKTAWVTYLESGSSSKLVKITLEDGPNYTTEGRVNATPIAGAELGQNFPNPFNPSTVIPYVTPIDGSVEIRVMDDLGRVMITTNETVTAGRHERRIDCSSLTSGSYTYELRINGLAVATRRMTLMK